MHEPPRPWAEDARPDLEQVRRALEVHAREVLLLLEPSGALVASSASVAFGYGESDRVGRHVAEHLHPDDLPAVYEVFERARATPGFEEQVRCRVRCADGSWQQVEATVIDATDDPVLRGAVLRVRQLDEDADAPAPSPADRFLSLAEALPQGILSADARGYVVFCNEAAQQILNLEADDLHGRGWERAVHAEDRVEVAHAAGNVVVVGHRTQVTFRVHTGMFPRWVHATFVPLGDDGRATGWIATLDDVTDRRRSESRLAHQATHDALTDLPNRTLLEDRLSQAFSRLRRGAESVSVLFIDLDRFKEINDEHGHQFGDGVLVEVARRLARATRDVDTVSRLGGDEFVVVCEDLAPDELEAVKARIQDVVAVPMLLEGEAVQVGASVGVATTRDPATEPASLLSSADQSMYRDKEHRRPGSAVPRTA